MKKAFKYSEQIWPSITFSLISIWAFVDATSKALFGSIQWEEIGVDFHVMYMFSNQVIENNGVYPATPYPYPPPSVIFQYFFTLFSIEKALIIWLFCVLGCNLINWVLIYKLLNFSPKQSLLLIVAYGSVVHFFQWDLRSLNCNIIFLLLVVLGLFFYARKDIILTCLFFVLSFSLKLFSIFLFPLLLLTRKFLIYIWVSLFITMIWIILPLIFLGPKGFSTAYVSWFQQIQMVSNEDPDIPHPIRVSLADSLNNVFGKESIFFKSTLWLFRLSWFSQMFAIIGIGFLLPKTFQNQMVFMSCVSVFLLGPICLSPYLEPYHPTPYAIPISIILSFAALPKYSLKIRLISIVIFIISCGFMMFPGGRPYRGLLINLSLLTACTGSLLLTVYHAHFSINNNYPKASID